MNRFRSTAALVALSASAVFCVSVLGCEDNPRFLFDPGAASNLAVDGSFERPRIAAQEYDSYSAGESIGPWFIAAGAVDHLSSPIWSTADGSQALDMDGSCGTGTIVQDLATAASVVYELRFAIAGNPGGAPLVKSLEVSWGDSVVDTLTFDSTGRSKGNLAWEFHQYTVVAPSGTTRLTFRSLSPGCYGMLLDAVSVRPETI